jgi:hypothetical protein
MTEPWTRNLWAAVWLVRHGSDHLTPEERAYLRPYAKIVRDLGLVPQHGIPGDPQQDAALCATADARAKQVYEDLLAKT